MRIPLFCLALIGCGVGDPGAQPSEPESPPSEQATQQPEATIDPAKATHVLVRASKCGFQPAGTVSSFAPAVEMVTGQGTALQKQKTHAHLPGTWWCVLGAFRVEGGEAPQGPLLVSSSPLDATVSIPGVQWLPEKRQEVTFSPPEPPPPPDMGLLVLPVFVGNGAYEKAMRQASDKTFTEDAEQKRRGCDEARNVVGDPEAGRQKAMELQRAYLANGSLKVPGNSLDMTLEILHRRCDPQPVATQ